MSSRVPDWIRVGALLLLAAIGNDLASVHCDEDLPGAAAAAVTMSSPSSGNDACRTVCVPDCFCCGRTDEPRPVTLSRGPGAPPAPIVVADARPVVGFRVLPYHPPLIAA